MEEGDRYFFIYSYNSGVSYFWHISACIFLLKVIPLGCEKQKPKKQCERRYKGVLNWFKENVPVAETELHYDDPYQLLIAVILSAQCTDKRVNMITPALFEAFPTRGNGG